MIGIPNLTRSPSGIYKYRRVVPKALRTFVRKSEIKESLGRNRAEAERRAKELNVETDQLFADGRQKLTSEESHQDRQKEQWEINLEAAAIRDDGTEHPFTPEISYQEAVRLAEVWLLEKLTNDEEDIATSGCESLVEGFMRAKGLIQKIDTEVKMSWLSPRDKKLLRGMAELDPKTADDILDDARTREDRSLDIDFSRCQSDDDRLEIILQLVIADARVHHEDFDIEVTSFCIFHGLNPDPNGSGIWYLRNAIARAWLTALRERRRKQSGDWAFPLPKDIG